MDLKVRLIRWAGSSCNIVTKGHFLEASNLWHVYVFDQWKAVGKDDVEILKD